MIVLPVYDLATLPCPILNGYGTAQETVKKYLGGEFAIQKSKINVTLFAKSEQELLALADFYYNTILSGTTLFKIAIPFEGVTNYEWTVKLIGGFDTKYVFTTVSEKKITLEIQDDVPTIVREAMVRQQIAGA